MWQMELDSFQKQALIVDLPDVDFDPTIEPTTGEEYLKKVIHERMQCPAIVVKAAGVKRSVPVATDLQKLFSESIVDSSDERLRPTPEWKYYQLKDFTKLRQKVVDLRLRLSDEGISSNQTPLTDDEDLWRNFCLENQPLLSTVLRIDQRSLEALLEFQANWLREHRDGVIIIELANCHKWLGAWIYATLACLHLPLEPSVHSALRDIAKSCILVRNRLSKEQEEEASPLNLFIYLISKYFNQLDLAEYV